MPSTSPGYSITIRAEAPPAIGATADLAAAVLAAGGSLTALDVVESSPTFIVVDVSCDAVDAEHADAGHPVDRRAARGHRPQGLRPHLPAAPGRQDRGRSQGAAQAPRRPVPGLHARVSPGSAWPSPRTRPTPAG